MSRTTRNTIIGWGLYLVLVVIIMLNVADPILVGAHLISVYIFQLIIFYFNYFFLAPKILEKKKVGIYFLSIAIVLIIFSILGDHLFYLLNDNIIPADGEHRLVAPTKWAPPLRAFFTNTIAVIISNLIVKSNLLNKTNQEKLELKNKVLEAETMALKSQINPHFLFNALNNIYALSQTNNEKTGDAILQLSHLLSYVTYEGEKKQVKLAAEIEYIKHFIQLQYLKDDDNSNIEVLFPEELPNLSISPLLLIPFVENAFKHGNVFDKKNGWVRINVKTEDETLFLNVSNSIGDPEQRKDKVGGVGLENVKKRLALLYKGHYVLDIKQIDQVYNVALKIDLIP